MTEPDASIEKRRDGGDANFDAAPTAQSIWPAIYPELLKLVREHTSTIIFVNNRRGAERLAKRLNELANEEEWQELPATEHAGQRTPPRPEAATGAGRSCPSPPRLAGPRGAHRGRGAAQVRAAPLPGGHLVARARDRHGRRRSGDPGRVAEVRDPRPPADRAGGPHPRRGLRGAHLPEVPRRPARVRGGRPADARGEDRGDRDPAQPARRARPAPGLDVRRRRVAGGRGRALGHRRRALLRALPRAARERPRHARRALPVRPLRGAAAAAGLGPRRRDHSRPARRQAARGHQRRHDSRPRPLRRSPAGRPPGWRARRGDGVRGSPGPDVPARRDHLADRGDHPRPGDRHPGPRGPGSGAVLEGRRRRSAGGARQGDRRLRPRGGERGPEGPGGRVRPGPARGREPGRLPARAAGRHARRPLRRDGGRGALSRRDRRLAPVRALALGRARPRRLGPGSVGPDPRRARAGGRRHLVRRRHRRPPPRRRRGAAGRPRPAGGRRG